MDHEPLEGIGAADAHLGQPMPLPAAALPLVSFVAICAQGPGAVEVAWNLDDTRPGSPGRLALYVGVASPAERGFGAAEPLGRYAHRRLALEDAQTSLRPAHELAWATGGLHLRLTGQGPWTLEALVALADSTG